MDEIIKALPASWIGLESGAEHKQYDDAIIDAYLEGKKQGLAEYIEEKRALIRTNLAKVSRITHDVYKTIVNLGFTFCDAYLKIESPYQYEVIIVVGEEETLADKMVDIYTAIGEIERNNDDSFHIVISLMEFENTIDMEGMSSDGFRYKFQKQV